MIKKILDRFARKPQGPAHGNGVTATDAALPEALRRYQALEFGAAQSIADGIVERDPGDHGAWNLLGAVAAATGQHELAVRRFERAIDLVPANVDYLNNCGEACRRAGWLDDAIEHCRAAILLDPAHAGAHYNLALALHAIGEVAPAVAELKQALDLQPEARAARSALLFMLCHLPDADGDLVLAEHRRWNEMHAQLLAPAALVAAPAPLAARRLRVGFVSGDFKRHALAYFIEPVFAHHDRERCEIYCYSNTRHTDEITAQLRGHVAQWRDVTRLTDTETAALVARDGIDILVDLSGHTADSRILVFARKPAPVQISYVGYPNTTGMATIDYRITDAYVDPPGIADSMYTERLLRMPHSLWCYRPPAGMPDVNALPSRRRGVTTFGSLHAFTKINSGVINLWARLLARVPASELLVAVVPDGETGARLLASFASRGIDAARIQLVGKLNFDAYLQLFHCIDIGLDAFPCAGGTTTCESLWMGVPVVTLAGKFGVARAGASLLNSAGLPELVAGSPAEYIEIAANLACNQDALAQLRGRLREQTRRSALMDEVGFTRAFEALLRGAFDAASGTAT